MRTTGPCSARLYFFSCFSWHITLPIPTMCCSLSRTGWQTAVSSAVWSHCSFFKFCRTLQCDFPPVQVLFFVPYNQTKGEMFYLSPFVWCGRQDLNLHDCSMDPKSIASAISPRPHFLAATFLSYNFTVLSTYRRLFIV